MKKEKFTSISLAFMGFMSVWGFGNAINGFSHFNGLGVSLYWILVLALYFVPYSLMVGELGSTFSSESGGLSLWINKTTTKKIAFFAGWMYYVVHLPYISQKPLNIIIAGSWAIFGESKVSAMSVQTTQLLSLAIFFIALFMATRGMSLLKKLSSLAGVSLFILSLLYVLMTIAAPSITGVSMNAITLESFKPQINLSTISNLSILILAVGGCEKISPYVNKLDDPKKDFPKGMIFLAIMVVACALLSTVALGMMFPSTNIPEDLLTNGAFYAFQLLGEYYNLGNLFLTIYSICSLISFTAVIVISIDAPLHMLLGNNDKENIPEWFYKTNERGIYVNGLKVTATIVSFLIILPMLGIENVNQLVKWLIKLNSICMPLRYLWVFIAYILLKVKSDKFTSGDFVFVKNRKLGIAIGVWCFFVTAASCIMGMYSKNTFELVTNILTPIVLVLSGFMLPAINKIILNKKSKI